MLYFHDKVGYNYRLVNILAAVGVAQMEKLPEFIIKTWFLLSLSESASKREFPLDTLISKLPEKLKASYHATKTDRPCDTRTSRH